MVRETELSLRFVPALAHERRKNLGEFPGVPLETILTLRFSRLDSTSKSIAEVTARLRRASPT